MYILINKQNYNTKVYKDKTELCNTLKISTKTLNRHLEDKKVFQNDQYVVSIPSYIQEKSNRGGKRSRFDGYF